MSASSQDSPYKIFISYRRDDTQDTCGRLYDRLKDRFGAPAIFMDVEGAIPPGYSFASFIAAVIPQCRVALIVIGSSWTTLRASDGVYAGQPRLDDPHDPVRVEVEQALALAPVDAAGRPTSKLLLIPLLVQDARMPRIEELPPSLRELPGRNATTIQRGRDFDHDMHRLLTTIATWMDAAPSPQPQPDTDPIAEMLATFLPQLRSAFAEQDWSQVARLASYIQRNISADRVPTEVLAIQGRALMAQRNYAGAKAAWDAVRARNPLDAAAFRSAAEARIALGTAGDKAEALPLLDDALTLTNDRVQRLPLLRISAHVLTDVANSERGATAQEHWNTLLRTASEGLRLAGAQDAGWLATKLEALQGLGQRQEALAVARTLTALPHATVAAWLTHARLAWTLAGETPTDEVRQALDAATRLAPNDASVTQARQQMLALLKPDRFPPRLAAPELGFAVHKRNGVIFIVPPVCPVPGGNFLMGSDPRRGREAQNCPDEQPQKSIPVGDFAIGRFPVTVAEYACFVEAAQHRKPDDWPNQLQKLDHPVVFVSWDDAVAYAAWLARITQQPWRLPTEAEWEKAARWDARTGVARLYPWGDTFDASRCNTSEGGKQGTTAIGSYPNGASPYGAEEMAGNVWEWTHSLYKPYPYTGSDGREVDNSTENRVLRGGSWGNLRQNARAAFRGSFQPGVRNLYYIGFRLALAGPGSA